MPNKMFSATRSAFATDLQSALVAKYGAGVTIHYAVGAIIIFTCPAISNKVIRLELKNSVYNTNYHEHIIASYGDAYEGATTITNPVYFSGETISSNSTGVASDKLQFTNIDVILGDYFLLISGNPAGKSMTLVGTLTNGEHLFLGLNYRVGPALYPTYCAIFVPESAGQITPITFGGVLTKDGNNFLTMPIYFALTGGIIKNTDGTYATIQDLYIASYGTRLATANFYASDTFWYDTSGRLLFPSSIFAPLS